MLQDIRRYKLGKSGSKFQHGCSSLFEHSVWHNPKLILNDPKGQSTHLGLVRYHSEPEKRQTAEQFFFSENEME